MFAYVFQVHLYDIRGMIGMVYFNPIQRHFGTYFIKQRKIIECKASFLTPWMCNQADPTTAVSSTDSLGNIRHNRMETGLANHMQCRLPVGSIPMFAQQAAIIRRSAQLPPILSQYLFLARKFVPFATQFLVHFQRILQLESHHLLRNITEEIMRGIKAIAQYMA